MGESVPTFEEIRTLLAETKVQMAENADLMKALIRSVEETDRKMTEIDVMLKGAVIYGKEFVRRKKLVTFDMKDPFIEDIIDPDKAVYDSLWDDLLFGGVRFDSIRRELASSRSYRDGRKFYVHISVAMFNDTSVALIETASDVKKETLEHLINENIPKFKMFYPDYKDFKIYLGLGGVSFGDGVEEEALQKGIGIFKIYDDAVEIYDKHVRAWN
jgi:hypothetical protein